MSSEFGKNIKISIFGQSHSPSIGVVMDGLKAGQKLSMERIRKFMLRRAPGQNKYSTPRKETDEVKILSGIVDDYTCGAPLCAVIENNNIKSQDYDNLKNTPRPSHADYPAFIKYQGYNDIRGGGHFSGRLTAPLCFAGAVCMEYLEKMNIFIGAHIGAIGEICDKPYDPVNISASQLQTITNKEFPVIDDLAGKLMKEEIENVAGIGDSVGGIIECAIVGMPVGIGSPMFEGVENRLSAALFGIPAVKGVEFGLGFQNRFFKGSENNDAYYSEEGKIKTKTNNNGGILGGITTGMPIIFRVAVKPTPSIAMEQDTVNLLEQKNVKLKIVGRHDPCILTRAVPCVEAVAACVLLDMLYDEPIRLVPDK